jgi:TPR repeat protein
MTWRRRIVGVALGLAVSAPCLGWDQFNDEANRQRQMASMRDAATTADNQAFDRSMSSSGSSSSGGGGSGNSYVGGSTAWMPKYAASDLTIPKQSVVASYRYQVWVPETRASALARLTADANAGSAAGQYELASVLWAGVVGNRDDVEARRWLQAAAAQGYLPAQTRLGYFLGMGLGGPKDEAAGEMWLQRAANAGSAPAQSMLARILILKDEPAVQQQAIAMMKVAVQNDDMASAALLGTLCATGNMVEKSDSEGARLLRIAALQGEPGSMAMLATMVADGRATTPADEGPAVWMERAADLGDLQGIMNYGIYLLNGDHGVTANPEKGAQYIERAANKGAVRAQWMIGVLFDQGIGVPKNAALAARWLRMAAAQGEQQAISLLKRPDLAALR